jgi:hypothetical protein
MSLSQIWKLGLASLCALSLAACAGSRQGGSDDMDNTEYSEEGAESAQAAKAVDEDELKKTQEDAVKATEENHELRRQIFEAKTKLGISTQPEESAAAAE